MTFDPITAETRFGCGLSPVVAPPTDIAAMLATLAGPDTAAIAHPIDSFDTARNRILAMSKARSAIRNSDSDTAEADAKTLRKAFLRETQGHWTRWFTHSMLRRATTGDGLRERLAFFWGDHFTAKGKKNSLSKAATAYVESAIRPHVAGRFEDMLTAVVTHPLMIVYLDQQNSIGPASTAARKRENKKLGLNENLARELLELHTLGVDGPYGQTDVRQLAELLTGLNWSVHHGARYLPNLAEPGGERVLGKWYGAQQGTLEDIHNVLRDLARHPATARHLAWKLAVHFVADTPDPDMVAAMERAYLDTNGLLTEVYRAMLDHPAAWTGTGTLKQPVAFIGSSLRATGLSPADTAHWEAHFVRRNLLRPLQIMGQPWEDADGPDGWPEDDLAWRTPQGLAARLQWALRVPEILGREPTDPRQFVFDALGPQPPERVRFAAEAAESRREGVALVLMAPAFQRH